MRSIVIAPARTGRERRRSTAVVNTDQANRGVWSNMRPKVRRLWIVLIKLIAPSREAIPAKWSEKIAQSTEAPVWAIFLLSGG